MVTGVARVGGAASPAGTRPGTTAGAASGFTLGVSNPAPGVAPAAPLAAVDGMLLMQAVEDGPTRDRQARRHGRAMLDGLAALQRALLGEPGDPDGVSRGALDRLAALAGHCPQAEDPALRATLNAIALRARVELARREV